MNKGPKNTILSDPAPFLPPDAAPKPERVKVSDWAKLGKSRKYKQVDKYIEARKEFFRHFTPSGDSFSKLLIEDKDAAVMWASIASEVIKELDDVQYRIQKETEAAR